MSESAWRDIESAPKDGTAVLLYAVGADKRPMRVIAHWACATHCFSSGLPPCRLGKPDSTCDLRWLGELGTRYGVTFTLWRPLPAPPGAGESTEGGSDV